MSRLGNSLASKGVKWALCMYGVGLGLSLCVPLFASTFAILLLVIRACALTLWMAIF